MNSSIHRFGPIGLVTCVGFFVAISPARAQGSFSLLHSLLNPGTNAQAGPQQGYKVAADGNLAVVAAPFDDVAASDSGLVRVYDATTGVLLHTLINPRPAAGDSFGTAIAISGLGVVVGAANHDQDTETPDVGIAYVYDLGRISPAIPVLTLTNPAPTAYDHFGGAVAVFGSRVVVAASEEDAGTNNAGAIYVYDLASGTPTVPIITLTNPSPTVSDYFGAAVALSETRLVVGAPGVFNAAGKAYVFDLDGPTPTLPAVTPQNASLRNGRFGFAVSISGARVVIGAPQDAPPDDSGSVFVYDLTSPTPSVPALTLREPALLQTGDRFGNSVSVSGTWLVVGADQDNSGGDNSGIAYLYDLSSTTPTVPAVVLTNPTPALNDGFGFAVAVSGTRVVIGAPGDDDPTIESGTAYLFDLAGAVPAIPRAKLNTFSLVASERFGFSVAVSGTRVLVGAPYDDTLAGDAGSVYVYDLARATPLVPAIILTNPSPAAGEGFGYAVSISGGRAVVGTINAGNAYVYDLDRPVPTVPFATLTIPGSGSDNAFGSSVSISGTRVVIGASSQDVAGLNAAGSAYVYDLAGVAPSVPIVTLLHPSPAANDRFGYAVAISGTRIVVGAYLDNAGRSNNGSVHVYDLTNFIPAAPVVTLTSPVPEQDGYFGYSVAIFGAQVVVGAPKHNIGQFNAGSAYVYNLASANPAFSVITLTNPSPAASDWFGYSVAVSGTRIVVGTPFDNTGAANAGTAYLYELATAGPAVPLIMLRNPTPAVSEWFGQSVAIDGAIIVCGTPYEDSSGPDRGAAYLFSIAPTLRIVSAGAGSAIVSWTPVPSPGFVLQHRDSVAPADWVDAPSGAMNPATISTTNSGRFYRLFYP